MTSINVAIPTQCNLCGGDFKSKRQKRLHVGKGLCRPKRESSDVHAYASPEARGNSYTYNQVGWFSRS